MDETTKNIQTKLTDAGYDNAVAIASEAELIAKAACRATFDHC
jgi:hypothetical protein